MKLPIYNKWCILLTILLLTTACSKEKAVNEPPIEEGTESISFAGSLVRSDIPNTTNLYLKAFLSGNPPTIQYLGETPISAVGGLSSTEANLVFPGAVPFYPIGNIEIRFFAYTGKAPNDKMQLNAGLGSTYDYVLSSYGKRSSASGVDSGDEGMGTPGSSTDEAELLQFRHAMTQLIVDVQVDALETPTPVDPKPTSVKFTLPGVVAKGEYGIRSKAPVSGSESSADVALNTSGTYTIQLGENYLVPNGIEITNQSLSSLIIDDYIATPADLAGFTIAPDIVGDKMWLVSGYSYKLTLTVQRLKVTGINIQQISWQTREMSDNNTTFTPQPLALSLGSYANTGADAITKVVLHTSDNKIYTGGVSNNQIAFITLPTSGVVQADLYTAQGLLISAPITSEYTTGALSLNLSTGGMLLKNPLLSPSATNPYLVTTPAQFLNIAKNLSASYMQADTIDLRSLSVSGAAAIFSGFGELTGTYDGNGLYISNVSINGSGLFSANSGTIKNVRLYTGAVDASGQPYAGSICGINNGIVVACLNELQIVNASGTVGGICGINNAGGIVLASVNTGNIPTGAIIGGVVGQNNNPNEGAIAACINTGMLNKLGANLGGICGSSVTSPSNIIRTSFWLVGTVQKYVGGYETVVDTNGVGSFDSTGLDPDALRNGLSAGDTEDKRVVNRLNTEMLLYPAWSSQYTYIIDRTKTGITWPAPVKK